MRPYLAVVSARIRMGLQYRAAALAGFGTQLFWGLIRLMIFDAFFRSSMVAQPMSFEQTVDYLWLTQALLLLLPMRLDAEIQQMIRTGAVAYELARPIDLYWFWFSRTVGSRTAPMLLRAAPLYAVAILFFGLKPPASLAAAGGFALSVGAAGILGCALATLMSITLLWTISGDGISRLLSMLAYVFSGSVVPLPFYPLWAQRILDLLPFRGLMDTPFRLYSGHIPPQELPFAVGHQLAWALGLILLGRWLLGRGARRMVVQGG
jgi:ABC-2 type transport system permease protein